MKAICRALTLREKYPDQWQALVKRGMKQDHSWDASAKAYEGLFAGM